MNARQKAKKLKKENESLRRGIIKPTINIIPRHVEKLCMKFLLEPFVPESVMEEKIRRSFMNELVENGFICMRKECDLITGRTKLFVSMLASKWPAEWGG